MLYAIAMAQITIINIIYYAWDDILQSNVCRNHRVWAEDLVSNGFISCTLSDAADTNDDDGEWTSASNNYHTHAHTLLTSTHCGMERTTRFFNRKVITSPTDGGPPWRGGGAYGLRGFCRFGFYEYKGKETTNKRPPVWPSEPGLWVLKSPGTPFTACVHRAFWQYHDLRAFSWVDTGAPGIKSDWCIYGIHAVYGCLAVWEPHQWWWAL